MKTEISDIMASFYKLKGSSRHQGTDKLININPNVLAVKCPITTIMYYIKKPSFPDQVSFMVNISAILSPVTSDGFINCAELVGSMSYYNKIYKFYAHVSDPADAYDLICCTCYLLRNGLHNLQAFRKYQMVLYFPSTMNTLHFDKYISNGISIHVLSIRVDIGRTFGNLMHERWSQLKNMLKVVDFCLTNDEIKEPTISYL